jgi:hypothetical protein
MLEGDAVRVRVRVVDEARAVVRKVAAMLGAVRLRAAWESNLRERWAAEERQLRNRSGS